MGTFPLALAGSPLLSPAWREKSGAIHRLGTSCPRAGPPLLNWAGGRSHWHHLGGVLSTVPSKYMGSVSRDADSRPRQVVGRMAWKEPRMWPHLSAGPLALGGPEQVPSLLHVQESEELWSGRQPRGPAPHAAPSELEARAGSARGRGRDSSSLSPCAQGITPPEDPTEQPSLRAGACISPPPAPALGCLCEASGFRGVPAASDQPCCPSPPRPVFLAALPWGTQISLAQPDPAPQPLRTARLA